LTEKKIRPIVSNEIFLLSYVSPFQNQAGAKLRSGEQAVVLRSMEKPVKPDQIPARFFR
jgi:hypothetical protein